MPEPYAIIFPRTGFRNQEIIPHTLTKIHRICIISRRIVLYVERICVPCILLRIFAVLLTICLIICSLSLPVSATATVLPYTQSSDSLTTNGLYLRLNLRNEWGNSNCTDLQPSSASDYLSVTFTISGLGKLSEPYVVSLLGAAEDLTFSEQRKIQQPPARCILHGTEHIR